MEANRLKIKWAKGECAFGVIAPNLDANLAETIGLLGFDFYMVDAEHGPADPIAAENLVRACELTGATPLARVRSIDAKLVLQYMDTGLMGVMMPGVDTAEEAAALVDAVKYPPVGTRGLGPVRAARYLMGGQSQAEYVAMANRETLVLPQIETMKAVENLAEMTRVPGVDGFVIGPRDLAMDMGFIDGPKHPEVAEAIDGVFDRVRAAGLALGTVAGTGAQARQLAERGASLVLASVAGLLKNASADFLTAARG